MTKSVSRGPDLLHGPVFSNMTRFFLPIMLGSLLQQLYSMVDAVVLGRLVGKTALAAVGGSDLVIINLVVGFFVGLSSGRLRRRLAALRRGEGDMVRKSVHTAILFSVVIGAVMTALGILMARPVLVLLDPPADTLADSIIYLQWYFAGMIPSMVYNMGAGHSARGGPIRNGRSISSSSARWPTRAGSSVCRRFRTWNGGRGHGDQPVAADLRGARDLGAAAYSGRLPPACVGAAL